ncbi:hypothetical protein BD560DRAFT_420363 [Blakeslea trispora]|nr:hypothetical protein BD560DRAFT_420363 [Blakeslea trispora]
MFLTQASVSFQLVPDPDEILWAQVATRCQQLRVPLSSRSRHQDSTVKFVPEVTFQSSDYETELINFGLIVGHTTFLDTAQSIRLKSILARASSMEGLASILQRVVPVCLYCRQAGYFHHDRPKLKNQAYFGCGHRGHTLCFCDKQRTNYAEAGSEIF